jgi:hypothetical protein
VTLKEDEYPVDQRGRPDLRRYTDSLAYYTRMYEQHLDTLEGRKKGKGYEVELSFNRRVHATWGLIAKGVEAIPYALGLLRRSEAEAREDGASILAEIGRDDGAVTELLESLKAETDQTSKDSLIAALGRLKARQAIPVLAAIIRDPSQDGDTRWTAVESLGLIVRRRFLDQKEPLQAAIAWLAKHPADSKSETAGT